MEPIDYFASVSFMEQKCPSCENKIEYGLTTAWDESKNAHKCNGCGTFLE